MNQPESTGSSEPEQQPRSSSLQIAAAFDGGDLDCGNGLLLLIRKHIDPLPAGALLELRSRESSVREDLPAWCRMTGNELVHVWPLERQMNRPETVFVISKGPQKRPAHTPEFSEISPPQLHAAPRTTPTRAASSTAQTKQWSALKLPALELPAWEPRTPLPPLAVMGIGSWPRPQWLLAAIHRHLSQQIAEVEFQAIADEAVRLAIQSQSQAGVDVFTDGEQRRDNYASFVGQHLENCQLIPLVDLLPYVDNPDEFRQSLDSLDVPADQVRHPAVFGPLRRRQSLSLPELQFARQWTQRPLKVSLPGPYLLTRMMWMECLSDQYYQDRDSLAEDVVRVLREELIELLMAGADLIQLDEPVLTEVVMGRAPSQRSFMCGALGEKLPVEVELERVRHWYSQLLAGLPAERLGIHICRGNWSRDESIALSGDYRGLIHLLEQLPVGNYWLEMCTPRAGEWECLQALPVDRRLGVGIVNQKLDVIESSDEIARRIERACRLFGADRVMLTPDCGFATFADRPLASDAIARGKLAAIVAGRNRVLGLR